MYLEINSNNPSERHIKQVVDVLRKGGVIIYPTDTVYGLGCDINNVKAFERVCRLKGVKPKKANFSFICNDLSHLSNFTTPIDNDIFRMLKKVLPGPFTFILKANNNVPKILKVNNKKTVGIRVPDNAIAQAIVKELGNPILSTSLKIDDEDDFMEYLTDPSEIYDQYEKLVDIVIDGGFGSLKASTVVDLTGDEPQIIRQGAGELEY
jgi:tRNA threonylcarbamoyl adenosine modification protein (Sua5/YciO/YrdC/YwlC family)